MNTLLRGVLACVMLLTMTACTTDAGQQPMIIAATDMQVESAPDPAAQSADRLPVADDSAPATALPPVTTTPTPEPAAAPAERVELSADLRDLAPGDAPTDGASLPAEVAAPAVESAGVAGESDAETGDLERSPAAPGAMPSEASSAALEPTVKVALAPATPSDFVDSYRLTARFTIVSTAADGIVQNLEITAEGAWKRAAHAFGYDASLTLESDNNGALQRLEYVMLGDHVALRTDDVWTTSPRGEELPIREPVAMVDVPFVGALSLGTPVGEEEVAGISTVHYQVDDVADFGALVADAFGGTAGELTSIMLDSWLAQDGYVVQYLLAATTTGATAQDSSGVDRTVAQTIDVAYAMSEVDGVEEILWPAEAPPPAALIVPGFDPDAFPLPGDAALQPSVGSLLFTTALAESALRDFYAEQLGAQGWSLDGEYGYYTARRGEQALVLAVTSGREGEPTRVEIFAEE